MHDDANFKNGRLRLAAFLRVIEHKMPTRPARFKKRSGQLTAQHKASDNRRDSHSDCAPTKASSDLESQVTSIDAAHHQLSISQNSLSTSKQSGFSDATRINQNQYISIEVRNDVSRPHKGTRPLGHNRDKQTLASNRQGKSPVLETARHLKEDGSVTEEISHVHHGRKSPTKRRHPVNELALVRISTEVDIPEPKDADAITFDHIMITDPIEDNQALTGSASACSSLLYQTMPQGARHNLQLNKQSHVVKKRFESLKNDPWVKFKKSSHLKLATYGDGFIGYELELSPKRQRIQHSKVVRPGRPQQGSNLPLALARGDLPVPIHNTAEEG
ncbi:hypothetical protein ACN47E_009865 [Coniothyrium glycines]